MWATWLFNCKAKQVDGASKPQGSKKGQSELSLNPQWADLSPYKPCNLLLDQAVTHLEKKVQGDDGYPWLLVCLIQKSLNGMYLAKHVTNLVQHAT